jgi:hypothetical protein
MRDREQQWAADMRRRKQPGEAYIQLLIRCRRRSDIRSFAAAPRQ